MRTLALAWRQLRRDLAAGDVRILFAALVLAVAGIVAQLGIGAYLLDLGASDDWCRQRIGLFVDKALAIANGAGLNHRHPAMLELAGTLSVGMSLL